jgi:hypothetical protein
MVSDRWGTCLTEREGVPLSPLPLPHLQRRTEGLFPENSDGYGKRPPHSPAWESWNAATVSRKDSKK